MILFGESWNSSQDVRDCAYASGTRVLAKSKSGRGCIRRFSTHATDLSLARRLPVHLNQLQKPMYVRLLLFPFLFLIHVWI